MREQIRPMLRTDVPRVHEIECACFRSPWSKSALMGEFRNDVAHYLVMEINETIEGYAGMWVLFNEAHLTNVAIMKDWRNMGCAKRLMYAMMDQALLLGATAMTLEVRESNIVAQRLYAQLDFIQHGYRPHYYTDSGEGAMILWNTDIQKTMDINSRR